MTNLWKILGISLGFIFLIFLIATQMITSGQDNLSQDNLNNAVRASVVGARDNSARTDRDTFVIDKQKFNQDFGNLMLKRYGDHSIQYGRDVKVDYLQDKDSNIPAMPNSNYEPIKAVSVKVNLNPNIQKKTNDKQNTHVITEVVQSQGHHDTTNDAGNDLTN